MGLLFFCYFLVFRLPPRVSVWKHFHKRCNRRTEPACTSPRTGHLDWPRDSDRR